MKSGTFEALAKRAASMGYELRYPTAQEESYNGFGESAEYYLDPYKRGQGSIIPCESLSDVAMELTCLAHDAVTCYEC